MARRAFPCDPECPNVTRTHISAGAVKECRDRRAAGEIRRAKALTPRPSTPHSLTLTAGKDYHSAVVTSDLCDLALWRPSFRDATLDMPVEYIEGAHLPGADLRGVKATLFAPHVPLFVMTESRGAIVDDEIVFGATQGDDAWLLCSPDGTPETSAARVALEFTVPFLQWAFTDSQWERLLCDGYDPDELVEAAQEFPPRNEPGFKAFMDSGDAAYALAVSPHHKAWGDRQLATPPLSNARRRQMRSVRQGV